MKITTKLLTILMIAVLTLSIAGCDGNKTGKSRKSNRINIEELQKNEGPMLVISCHPQEAMTKEQYDNAKYEMSVTYDGCVNLPNSFNPTGLKMTDEDYIKIYKFCTKNAEKSKFAKYKEDVCDGETYTFTYYDLDGNPHVIYDGYCYNNDELQDIMNTITYYQVD